MNTLEYFKASKIEEIASQYQGQGHQIVVSELDFFAPFEVKPLPYHLTASKCCRKVAIEVVERTKLGEERLDHLREQAHQEGFDTFMLGILNPPHETKAEIEGLEQQIFDHLARDVLDHLAELPAKVRPLSVDQIGLDSVFMRVDGIKVVGNGVVEVELSDGQGQFGFPLSFDVELDNNLHLKQVHDVAADTSSFYQSGHK